jgi:hypothetical protein
MVALGGFLALLGRLKRELLARAPYREALA